MIKYLPLVRAGLGRRKLRTLFTVLTVTAAFLLFGILGAVEHAFTLGIDLAGADRLITIHKVSIIQPLPISYDQRIAQVEGVADVTHSTWFGGIYQDERNFFPQMAVEPESFLRLYPEYRLDDAARERWIATRTGAIAGESVARRFGWEVGDRIPIRATIWQRQDGSDTWEFDLVGIYEGAERGTDTTQLFFQWDYLDEARRFGDGTTGWYVVRVEDPDRAAEVAEAIDTRFANSPAETKTTTEKAFIQAFAAQIGDIGAIVAWIVTAVFFILLLVVGTTMAQSVRERTSELAVLKTVGFTRGKVLALVLAEATLVALLGAVLGLGLAQPLVAGLGTALEDFLPVFFIPPPLLVQGVVLALVLGLAAGSLPALQAMRLRVVDALRRV